MALTVKSLLGCSRGVKQPRSEEASSRLASADAGKDDGGSEIGVDELGTYSSALAGHRGPFRGVSLVVGSCVDC
jgi:hypothetical protein